LVVNVDEGQLGQISEGQPVRLQVPAYPNTDFNGTVKAIAPRLDSKSRTAAVHIAPDDTQAKLRAGMFARVSILVADREAALVVPRDAIVSGLSEQPAVVTIEGGATARRRLVTLGIQNERLVEIVAGLDEGSLVATSGVSDLRDGDAVAPQGDLAVALAR
jgi:membrane fusion protein (multidrug efflux system)